MGIFQNIRGVVFLRRISLSIASILLLVCFTNFAWLSDSSQVVHAEANDTYQLNQNEQKVVELVNQERTKRGLLPLTISTKVSQFAREKAEDMRDKNYFDHHSPTYGDPCDHMKNSGVNYSYCGENIAAGQQTPEEVMNAWMSDAGHRDNILSPKYKYIGVGYVDGNDTNQYKTYWTQQFYG